MSLLAEAFALGATPPSLPVLRPSKPGRAAHEAPESTPSAFAGAATVLVAGVFMRRRTSFRTEAASQASRGWRTALLAARRGRKGRSSNRRTVESEPTATKQKTRKPSPKPKVSSEAKLASYMTAGMAKQKPASTPVPVETPVSDAGLPLAIPFLPVPQFRRFAANAPGDAGFDPLNLARDLKGFNNLREAELKHARLAMLAAVGWPLEEMLQPPLAKLTEQPSLLAPNSRAPSFLNGGFGEPQLILFLGILFIFTGILDVSKPDGPPGDNKFDPLGLREVRPPVIASFIPADRLWMDEAELKNGRLAMIAITGFVAYEYIQDAPVVQPMSPDALDFLMPLMGASPEGP